MKPKMAVVTLKTPLTKYFSNYYMEQLHGTIVNTFRHGLSEEEPRMVPKNLNRLIVALRNYSTVLVTGPQRAGTTITANILAKELGYEYIDESEFGAYDVFAAFKLYDTKTKFVMHGPGLSAYAQIFPGAIVFVKRATKDIVESEKRIGWDLSVTEKRRYFSDCTETHIADLKWKVWKKFQQLDKRFFDFNYVDLEGHELWVDKEKRKDFGGRQTSI